MSHADIELISTGINSVGAKLVDFDESSSVWVSSGFYIIYKHYYYNTEKKLNLKVPGLSIKAG